MRTFDGEFVRRAMTHRRVWPWIADDSAGAAADFQPVMAEHLYYLAPEHDGLRIGVFLYHAHTSVLWEVHTCVFPDFWGEPAMYGARAGLRWMVENTDCAKVITHVPSDNPSARRFALRVGMVDEGINWASFLKRGALLDQFVLGITKGEIECLQQQ